MDTALDSPVLSVTDAAMAKIIELRAAEPDADNLALRVEVTGTRGGEYSYDLAFEPMSEASEDDSRYHQGELPVWIPAGSVDSLQGATLDLPTAEGQGGLVLRNPNRPDPFDLGEIELTGDISEKVSKLLEAQINPMLAAHGGWAGLVKVEDDKVFVEMGGGCQGCAISAMTLRDGITQSIKDNVPEVAEVVDTTDHEAGENPYY